MFFADLLGHKDDEKVNEALAESEKMFVFEGFGFVSG